MSSNTQTFIVGEDTDMYIFTFNDERINPNSFLLWDIVHYESVIDNSYYSYFFGQSMPLIICNGFQVGECIAQVRLVGINKKIKNGTEITIRYKILDPTLDTPDK